ncbi:MAG: hypothetical protein EBV77_04945, partial [Gemmatimonadaceae bacterium]|nr:hypothetical protein [Gemmatimonadaceae bacterium]
REAGAVLAPNVGKYVFVSTLSTYKTRAKIGMTEADVDMLNPPSAPDATEKDASYGERKVRGEMDAKATFGENKTLIVRPGLIVGPGDLTDRFSYWPIRVEQGGAMLAPGTPDDPVAFIDQRDLTEFIVRLCEADATGTYNAVGPQHGLSMSEMLYGCKAVTTSDTRFTWVDADFLLERKLRPYADLPGRRRSSRCWRSGGRSRAESRGTGEAAAGAARYDRGGRRTGDAARGHIFLLRARELLHSARRA